MSKGTGNANAVRFLRRELEKAKATAQEDKKSISDYQNNLKREIEQVRFQQVRANKLHIKNQGLYVRLANHDAAYRSLPAIVRFFVPKALRDI